MTQVHGWQYYHYAELGSTNDEAQKFCQQKGCRTVVRCDTQTAGRGRHGRSWLGLSGNLFFSLAFEFDLRYIGHLVTMTGLSLAQAVLQFYPNADIVLKWPNDVLLNGAKLSGILLEKAAGDYVIVGIGVNVAHSPQEGETPYPTISLAEAGIQTNAEEFMERYLSCFNANLELLARDGFEPIRHTWLALAGNLEKEIIVQQGNVEKRGIFTGIDENAVLLLKTETGVEKILAGDVFFVEKKR